MVISKKLSSKALSNSFLQHYTAVYNACTIRLVALLQENTSASDVSRTRDTALCCLEMLGIGIWIFWRTVFAADKLILPVFGTHSHVSIDACGKSNINLNKSFICEYKLVIRSRVKVWLICSFISTILIEVSSANLGISMVKCSEHS